MKKNLQLILALVSAVILLQTLYFKFTAQPESVALFTKLGIEPYGRIGTGVLELIAGILLLIPKTRSFGGFLGFGLMSGAILSHLVVIGIESDNDGGLLFIMASLVWICCLILAIPFIKLLLKRFKLVQS